MTQSAFDGFVRKWVHPKYETTPSSAGEVERCEAELGFLFPQAYVDAVREHGTPDVDIELLGAIADDASGLSDASEFIPLDRIAPITPETYLGVPEGYVPFASDCMGNPLCFARAENQIRQTDAPIWKWDHDYQQIDEIAPSFTALLKAWTKLPYPSAEKRLREEWESDIHAEGSAAEAIWQDIIRRHSERHRRYHGLEHLIALKRLMWAHTTGIYSATPPHLAIWWHDAIYDPQARDNEERSADLARTHLTQLGIDAAKIEETCRIILMTKNHWEGGSAGAGDYFLDADIAILGAKPEVYDAYARNVRQEYAWAPDDAYRAGRSAFLTKALTWPRLFRTEIFETTYGDQARENMRRELASLNGGAT